MKSTGCSCQEEAQFIRHKSVLVTLLAINGVMFAVECGAGLLADSTGLLADSLDMLADALVYGLALYAAGRAAADKIRAAWWSGLFQLGLAGFMLLDILRRWWRGSDPESWTMLAVSAVALAANLYCLRILSRERGQGVHMRASWIFSRNDVIANLGVLTASLMVWATGRAWPDLLIGAIITLVVFQGGRQILRDARREKEGQREVPRVSAPVDAASNRHRKAFRLLALLLVPGFLLLGEGVCRLTGWGNKSWSGRTVARESGQSLFLLNATNGLYEIRPSRWKFFVPESFSAVKEEGTFRIFFVGGSTVQGRPFGKETAFSTWLQLGLDEAQPDRRWEVINCGGVSYGSERLLRVWEECLQYEPDLMVLCTGHNEFLERKTQAFSSGRNAARRMASFVLEYSQAARALRNRWRLWRARDADWPPGDSSRQSFQDVDAFLDYRDGLKAYRRDPIWRKEIIQRFERNVRQFVAMAQEAEVPLLVLTPPSNLRDTPPFKSEHRPGLTREERQRWQDLMERVSRQFPTNLTRAVRLLEEARKLDDQHAETEFLLGKAHLALAQPEAAKEAFHRARDLDICPLRILSGMEEILDRASRETGVPHWNMHEHLEQASVWHILGNDWLVDHVHPSIRGHQKVARAILDLMIREGPVRPAPGWEARCSEAYKKHWATLDSLYFAKGRQRLENLRAWTQGRADGPLWEGAR